MATAFRPAWAGRLTRLQHQCAARDLAALVITNPVNIRYLCGFRGSSGMLLITRTAAVLLADGRYQQAVRESLRDGTLGPIDLEPVARGYDRALAACLDRLHLQQCGFEAGHVTVATFDLWRRLLPAVDWQSTTGLVEGFRAVKDEMEVATLRRAAEALSRVARGIPQWLAAGRSEREVARSIDRALETEGFSEPAFPTIVASGPQSALPHARPTDRRIGRGELVLLDFGGVLDGYCVDLTRMASVGPVAPELMKLFEAVRAAHAAAIARVRAGVAGSEVDRAARAVLDERGYGAAFVHSTGHGLGLEVHEAPRLGRAPEPEDTAAAVGRDTGAETTTGVEMLAAGMVCTIEPGAYLEGLGGARLEDDVLVTAEGCEVLTTASRDLEVV